MLVIIIRQFSEIHYEHTGILFIGNHQTDDSKFFVSIYYDIKERLTQGDGN